MSTSEHDAPLGEVHVSGYAAAPGTVLGPAWMLEPRTAAINEAMIADDQVEAEQQRFKKAVQSALRDVQAVVDLANAKIGSESAAIFDAQAMILRDDALLQAVMKRIEQEQMDATAAVHAVLEQYRTRLESSDTAYLQDRAADLRDTEQRLLRALNHTPLPAAEGERGIVVASMLTAADVVRFSQRNVLGCVCSTGGPTSHAALIARALELPTVVGARNLMAHVKPRDWLLVNGDTGDVVVRPNADTRAAYQAAQQQTEEPPSEVDAVPMRTADGTRIQMLANVEFPDQYEMLSAHNADGIGLMRTEMLFLMQSRMRVKEAAQYEQYTAAAQALQATQPLTIRLLDVGGDKMQPLQAHESNPFLGWRGIRVLLDRPDLVRPQLRAVLRVAQTRSVRLLLPMVTTMAEVKAMRRMIATTAASMELPHGTDRLQVGVMVEVPAVAWQAERFARISDFLALGTNDLTQYTLAADRSNARVAHHADAMHPVVLDLIRRTVQAGQAEGCPVSVCGEMAADPTAVPVLIGLGVRALSMAPPFFATVRRVVSQIERAEAEEMAHAVLHESDASAVRSEVGAWLNARDIEAGA